MLPTITLPAAAILLFLGHIPIEWPGIVQVREIFILTGNSIFTFLPYIFAAGVALGLTDNSSSAGMSALLSYFLFVQITQHYIESPVESLLDY